MKASDIWWEVKFYTWYYWQEFAHWWFYGSYEKVDETWQIFKIVADAEGGDEDEWSFIEHIEELELYFGGSLGGHGTGCNGWVEGPPDRMKDARKKLVRWFTQRGLKGLYVSGLRNYHKPHPHPALRRVICRCIK